MSSYWNPELVAARRDHQSLFCRPQWAPPSLGLWPTLSLAFLATGLRG